MRAFCLLLLLGLSRAPYARHTEAERSRSLIFSTAAFGLWLLAELDGEHDDEFAQFDATGLALAAAVPLMRRLPLVQHDARLDLDRLDAMFGANNGGFGSSPLNVWAQTRFRLEETSLGFCVAFAYPTASRLARATDSRARRDS